MNIQPYISEKSLLQAKSSVYTLRAPAGVSCGQVIKFLKTNLGVEVTDCKSMTRQGKKVRFKGHLATKPSYKLFRVKLVKGQKLDGYDLSSESEQTQTKDAKAKETKKDK